MLRTALVMALIPLIVGCGRAIDVLKYETSITRVQVNDSQVPAYETGPVEEALIDQLRTAGFTAFLHLDRQGRVHEWYAPGFSVSRAVNIKSVSKSLFSALVGLSDLPVTQPIATFANCDVPQELAPLTLAHLLNMTAGYAFIENQTTSVYASRDWGCAAMALPVAASSGARFNYNTLQYHLAGLQYAEALGQRTERQLQDALLEPMGIKLDGWVLSPDGDLFTGSELRLQPRDMLRFGHVMLQDGVWDGQQIIPAAWVRRTRTPVRGDTGRDGISYGWGWWQTQLSGQDVQFAEGYGGQAIVVAPDGGHVFVFTAPTGGLVSGAEHARRTQSLLSIVSRELASSDLSRK